MEILLRFCDKIRKELRMNIVEPIRSKKDLKKVEKF